MPARANLGRHAARVTLFLVAIQAVALFASAGTVSYWQAWLYLALQGVSMTATNLYLFERDPALLERRLTSESTGETERVQRVVMALLRPLTLGILVVAGLAQRFAWPAAVPPAVVVAGALVYCIGAGVVFRVFQANTFTSSVIEVAPEQTVVTTGPYRIVRHPMYLGVVVMGLATPLVLGNYLAELFIPPMFVLLVLRILAEERFLAAHLAGYRDYTESTSSRLVPGIW
jgi:protein-S-isoprenylcysteine O-methyltransferase Ste14